MSLRITLFCFLLSLIASAQSVNHTILAYQYYQKADSLQIERKADSSIVYFKKAIPLYEKAKSWKRVVACYNWISENQRRIADYKNSLISAETALHIHELKINEEDKEKANTYDHIGDYYKYHDSDFEMSLSYYEKALKIRKNISNTYPVEISKSHINLGWVYLDQNKPELALEHFNKALNLRIKYYGSQHSETANVYYYLGNYYLKKWEFEKALGYLQKTLEIKTNTLGKYHIQTSNVHRAIGIAHYSNQNTNLALFNFESELNIKLKVLGEKHPDVAGLYINIGSVYITKGNYKKALESLTKALHIQNDMLSENHSQFSVIYYNMAKIYSRTGEYEKALEYYFKTLSTDKKIFGNQNVELATNYNKIGLVYKDMERYDKAEEYFKKSIDLKEKVYGKDHIAIADTYNNLGTIYGRQNKPESALKYLQKSLSIKQKKYDENHRSIANSMKEIGSFLIEQGQFDEAEQHLTKALKTREQLYGKYNPTTKAILNLIGDCHYKNQQYNKALSYYEEALKIDKKNQTININYGVLLTTLKGKASTYTSLFNKTQNIQYLDSSEATYQQAEKTINIFRHNLRHYKDKLTLAKRSKEIYRGALQNQFLAYKKTSDIRFLKKAFIYNEIGKSSTLKEQLLQTDATSFAGLPEELIEMEKNLNVDRAYYKSKINREKDSAKITNYEDKLFAVNRTQDSLTHILEKNYPNYYRLKYQNEVVTVEEVQKQLDKNTTLLEFFTTDSITYACVITKNTLVVKELSTPNLQNNIENFRQSILDQNIKTYKTQAYQLYQHLIAPMKDQLVGKELIIVPDGPLWHLNFDLLITKQDNSNNPQELSYFLKNYAITYANSATLLYINFKTEKPIEKLQQCLAFSFTDSTNLTTNKTMDLAVLRDTEDDLPGTRKEIKAIADIIGGQYYFGSEANERNFKNNASKYNILHLALHGEVDNEQPENSRLYFTKTKDSIEDNLLYSHELFALNIPAELTVLSACNTGTGKIAKGEGIMSLGNAFQYAGTKSLLLTSWEVSDQTTPTLMKYFYANLKKGMSKATALQKAKLEYLTTTNPNRTNPFYWGAFYLVGDTTPMQLSSTSYWYWIIGLGILSLVMIFWILNRQKRK